MISAIAGRARQEPGSNPRVPDPVVTGLGARSGDHTGANPWRDEGVRGADFASSASAPALKALRTQIAAAHAADDPRSPMA